MPEKKQSEEKFASPIGVALYPHLTRPQTEINKKPVKPTYAVDMILDPDDADVITFRQKVEAAHAAGLAQAKKDAPKKRLKDEGTSNIFRDETDKEGTPTGKLLVRFKCNASGTRKDGTTWEFKPALIDAKGVPVKADTLVYGGSVMRVSYSIRHSAMETGSFYSKLQLHAVKVLVLKSQQDRDQSYYGFNDADDAEYLAGGEDVDNSGTQDGAGEVPSSGANF